MSNEMRLLRAFIECAGYKIEEIPVYKKRLDHRFEGGYEEIPTDGCDYKVTKKPKQTRATKDKLYTDEFNEAWELKPKRSGSNSKVEAYKVWNARINEVLSSDSFGAGVMKAGIKRYAAYVRHEGNEGTKYVMQLSTFLGPSRHYLEKWELVAKPEEKLKLPFTNEELPAFAKANNLKPPGRTETFTEYRRSLQVQIDSMVK